ncbi:MAG TPA: hypothetical protein VGN72_03995 [Tepidisphaeraceae bacterium]|jgi:hypothetical protein|nr:hypothetical protein [Tepidisphaeraceae bacterium]
MRWIFGLGGILITLLVIVIMLSAKGGPGDYTVTVLQKGKEARVEANQLAGKDADGMRTSDSIVMEAVPAGNRTGALLVSNIVVGGPMETYFGLKADDKIIEVGPQRVRDIDDPELAKALTLEAYQRRQTLVVDRGGAKFELPGNIPLDGGVPGVPGTPATPSAPTAGATTPDATAAPAAQDATPAAPKPGRSSIYDQVNKIPGVQPPSH